MGLGNSSGPPMSSGVFASASVFVSGPVALALFFFRLVFPVLLALSEFGLAGQSLLTLLPDHQRDIAAGKLWHA